MADIHAINYVDLIFLGIILISIIIGIVRGFTQEMLGIAGWLGAVFAAIYTLPFTRPVARQFISSSLIADITAGALVFLSVLIVLTLVCRSVSGRVKESALGGIDRSLGLLFGALRGFFILSLLYLMGASLTKIEKWPEKVRTAKALPFLDQGAQFIKTLLPDDFRPEHADQLKKDLRSSEEIMRNLSRLNPIRDKKEGESVEDSTYTPSQKKKMETLFGE